MLRIRKFLVWFTAAALVAIAGGEVVARYHLGLGTPMLSIAHPKIEYMVKPDQDIYRFNNHIIVNRYGMRTAPFAAPKADGEVRIMVFGDSVLNGGNQTDHAALATTLLQERLSNANRRVVVGNISAGSWGPGNWLAYAKEYGFFSADLVVLIISSHDYADNPTFRALNEKTHPTKAPISALLEGLTRYLPRHLPQLNAGEVASASNDLTPQVAEQNILNALNDLKVFLELAQKSSGNVLVLQHWEKREIESGLPSYGNQRIRELCESVGISPVSLEPYFRQAIENGKDPYRDNIHPNQTGQQLIANALYETLPGKILQQTR